MNFTYNVVTISYKIFPSRTERSNEIGQVDGIKGSAVDIDNRTDASLLGKYKIKKFSNDSVYWIRTLTCIHNFLLGSCLSTALQKQELLLYFLSEMGFSCVAEHVKVN